jgi:hypothetical protein
MLALLLFPMLEKASHDFEHFDDDHCNIKDKHYCKVEHSCQICAYVFSSSSIPPKTQDKLAVFAKASDNLASEIVVNTTTSQKFRLSLRGPPAC